MQFVLRSAELRGQGSTYLHVEGAADTVRRLRRRWWHVGRKVSRPLDLNRSFSGTRVLLGGTLCLLAQVLQCRTATAFGWPTTFRSCGMGRCDTAGCSAARRGLRICGGRTVVGVATAAHNTTNTRQAPPKALVEERRV